MFNIFHVPLIITSIVHGDQQLTDKRPLPASNSRRLSLIADPALVNKMFYGLSCSR